MSTRINPALLAAILAGPRGSGLPMTLRDVADFNAGLAALPKREHVPAGQCRGCRTRISVNKDYCLKCKTLVPA